MGHFRALPTAHSSQSADSRSRHFLLAQLDLKPTTLTVTRPFQVICALKSIYLLSRSILCEKDGFHAALVLNEL